MATIFERADFLIGSILKLLFFPRAGNFLIQSGYAVAEKFATTLLLDNATSAASENRTVSQALAF